MQTVTEERHGFLSQIVSRKDYLRAKEGTKCIPELLRISDNMKDSRLLGSLSGGNKQSLYDYLPILL